MKKALLALISLVAVVAVWIFISQNKNANAEAKIRELLARQSACWNQGDIDCFMEGYWKSDSLKFVGSSGITYGYKNTLDNYKKRYPDRDAMGELTFNILNLEEITEYSYLVVGQFKLKRKEDLGDLSGYFTLVLKKVNGDWVIISDHTSAS